MDFLYEVAKALIIGGVLAVVGYVVWHRQFGVQHSFELARRILVNVNKVKASLRALRATLSNTDPQHWEKVYSEATGVLWTDLIEADVIWPGLLKEPRDRLNALVGRYWMKRARLREVQDKAGLSEERRSEIIAELDEVVFEQDEGADSYGDELNAVVAQFESALRPKLSRW